MPDPEPSLAGVDMYHVDMYHIGITDAGNLCCRSNTRQLCGQSGTMTSKDFQTDTSKT